MDKEKFGNLIVVLRKWRGISQKELAEKLAVSASAVNKWERGNNLPDLSILDDLAKALGVTCDELINPERTLERLEEQFARVDAARRAVAGKEDAEDVIDFSVREEVKKSSATYRKGRWKLVVAGLLLFLLGIGAGVGGKTYLDIQELKRTTDYDLYPVNARYAEDPNYGKMLEISYVTRKKLDMDAIEVHTSSLKNMYIPGKTVADDTKGVHIYYYSNEDDARAWEDTDCGSVFFFQQKR